MNLKYENPGSGNGLTAGAAYNGNISQMSWQTTGNNPKGYGFGYDQLNRLKTASYADGTSFTSNANNYNTSYSYDKNGNIKILNRAKEGTPIDELSYKYLSDKSNQLKSVSDGTANAEGYHALDGNYKYDNNGNMNFDPSNGTTIDYNYLNLPQKVDFGADNEIRYVYDAAGAKHIKVVYGQTAPGNKRVDYSGPFVYEDNDLKSIFTSAGRIITVNVAGSVLYKFEYNLTDHLGNTRVSFDGHSNGSPELMAITDYYPFGMVMAQQNFVGSENYLQNKYLYNGKELQDDNLAGAKLDWYDYGARFYDPTIGRWHSVDPLAEWDFARSPYNYVTNNPMRYIDQDGNFKTKFGAWLWKTFNGGGETLQDNKTKEYFVSQRAENKDDADITVKRVFHGQRSYSRSESGETLEGGLSMSSTVGQGTPDKANHTEDIGNIDLLGLVSGRVGAGPFKPGILDFAKGLKRVMDIAKQNSGNITSDEKILEDHGGTQETKTDNKGMPIEKTDNEYKGNEADSIVEPLLYEDHPNEGFVYVQDHKIHKNSRDGRPISKPYKKYNK